MTKTQRDTADYWQTDWTVYQFYQESFLCFHFQFPTPLKTRTPNFVLHWSFYEGGLAIATAYTNHHYSVSSHYKLPVHAFWHKFLTTSWNCSSPLLQEQRVYKQSMLQLSFVSHLATVMTPDIVCIQEVVTRSQVQVSKFRDERWNNFMSCCVSALRYHVHRGCILPVASIRELDTVTSHNSTGKNSQYVSNLFSMK
jgi:hypothetical protein